MAGGARSAALTVDLGSLVSVVPGQVVRSCWHMNMKKYPSSLERQSCSAASGHHRKAVRTPPYQQQLRDTPAGISSTRDNSSSSLSFPRHQPPTHAQHSSGSTVAAGSIHVPDRAAVDITVLYGARGGPKNTVPSVVDEAGHHEDLVSRINGATTRANHQGRPGPASVAPRAA
jgi:hypothetical protein